MTILINAGDVSKIITKRKGLQATLFTLFYLTRPTCSSLLLHAARGGIMVRMRFTRWTAALIKSRFHNEKDDRTLSKKLRIREAKLVRNEEGK